MIEPTPLFVLEEFAFARLLELRAEASRERRLHPARTAWRRGARTISAVVRIPASVPTEPECCNQAA